MSNELVQTTFNYGVLDEETRVFVKVKAEAIQARLKRTAEDIVAIGQDLKEVQERLKRKNEGQGFRGENQGNGQFLAWLLSEFDMSKSTAYNFMAVAERFGEKLPTVGSFSPKILYALASASDEVVEKVESGEIEATLQAIQDAKKAERDAKEALKQAEEAEMLAREEAQQIQQQLFQTRRESVERVKLLQENYSNQIAELNQQIKTIQTPVKERVEVIPEETQKHLQSLEEKVATLQRQKDNLKELNEQLAKDLEVQEGVREQEERDARVRLEWKNATSAVSQSVLKFLGQLPLPADMQRFEPDDWERLEQVLEVLQRSMSACKALKASPAFMIIDATLARG